jgi:hypothetical protein
MGKRKNVSAHILRFDKGIYGRSVVDEAVTAFKGLGVKVLRDTPRSRYVLVEADSVLRVDRLAGDLYCYALGLAKRAHDS